MRIAPTLDEESIKKLDPESAIIQKAIVAAGIFAEDFEPPIDAAGVSPSGGRFIIPLVLPEGTPSGDGRIFETGALSTRDMPLCLMWQIKTDTGHDGSVVVGRIDSVDRIKNGLGNAKGVFDVGPYGRECERLVRDGMLRGISADLDMFEASQEPEKDEEELSEKERNSIKSRKITIDSARLMGITVVQKPAFQECIILMDDEPTLENGDDIVADGIYEDIIEDYDNELAALAASAAPVIPPRNWFTNPQLAGPTPLTIEDDGRVFGHIAAWNVSHIGLPRATKPPRSASNYAYFRTGVLRVDDGTDVHVGQLTLAGGHAPLSASAADAVKHYDDTLSAVADVSAGEDRFGIWVSGALRPDLTPSQVRAFRASSPSGDWRPIDGRLELVAVCAVNVPGFPVARVMVAGGQVQALVAAGAAAIAELKESKLSALEERVNAIEAAELSAKREQLMKRFAPIKSEHDEKLTALAASARERVLSLKKDESAELAAKMAELKARFNG